MHLKKSFSNSIKVRKKNASLYCMLKNIHYLNPMNKTANENIDQGYELAAAAGYTRISHYNLNGRPALQVQDSETGAVAIFRAYRSGLRLVSTVGYCEQIELSLALVLGHKFRA